jgi:2-keto-4-pentenoate hydratase/2-oxohepta-3-ene-1,7-dioic acid hydratase in catechol pathway
MRLGNVARDGGSRLCLRVDDETVLDAPGSIEDVLADPPAALAALAALARTAPAADHRRLADVVLAAPVPRPSKVIGVGLNYRDHAEEAGEAVPEFPPIFAKFPNSVTGPTAVIRLPERSTQVDWECELGVVIGRRTSRVAPADALGAVLGYLAVNDVSARDVQHLTSQWTIGKSFDTFAPTGPFLVTADEIPDPQSLEIMTRVNGDEMQHSNTKHMLFGVADLISELSHYMTLLPGDIIATGTPAGIGGAQDPPRFLAAGDVVEVEVEHIGILRNPVGR